MLRKHFYHGLAAGIMAALGAIIYSRINYFATMADFSVIINPATIISLNLIVCLAFSTAYYLYIRITDKRKIIVFHMLLAVVSFAAVLIPISISLPLSVRNPELFPGLVVPMVFLPALAWFTLKPLFSFN